ncbi:MAG TPA: flagellar hook-basal body complex protein [Terriglobales bacterium]|nr:flagellar hook-basal body complex protein [Terriglobales bacterium]
MPSFSVPLSGLNASSTWLSTIANNLANLNTTGYKDQLMQFADLFYQSVGSDGAGDPIQQGAGVKVSSQPSNFTQGDVTSNGIATNVAIDGNGFFIVQENGVQSYTRAGDFEVGTNNLLETTNGQEVMGYSAVNGVVDTSGGLSTLALGAGIVSPATVTRNVSLTSNLDAQSSFGTSYTTQVTVYDSLGGSHVVTFDYTSENKPAVQAVPAQAATGALTMSAIPQNGDTVVVGTQTYTFTTSTPGAGTNNVLIGSTIADTVANLVNAINGNTADSGGDGAGGYGTGTVANPNVTAADAGNGLINITASSTGVASDFTATSGSTGLTWSTGAGANGTDAVAGQPAVVNTWGYTVSIPAADLGGSASANPITLASGTLMFNGDGTLKSITPTNGSASLTNPTIAVPPNGSSFADGANQLTFTWHVVDANGNGLLTQEAAGSSTASIQQDGAASGTLKNFNIGSDGTITGAFSNGTTAILGQIALASFADEQGLSRTGNNDFQPTLASGQPTIGAPTTGGLGTLSGGALEQSNVDIASEFANLIVAQRSYEANARVVTTFDQVAQDTINLKQ